MDILMEILLFFSLYVLVALPARCEKVRRDFSIQSKAASHEFDWASPICADFTSFSVSEVSFFINDEPCNPASYSPETNQIYLENILRECLANGQCASSGFALNPVICTHNGKPSMGARMQYSCNIETATEQSVTTQQGITTSSVDESGNPSTMESLAKTKNSGVTVAPVDKSASSMEDFPVLPVALSATLCVMFIVILILSFYLYKKMKRQPEDAEHMPTKCDYMDPDIVKGMPAAYRPAVGGPIISPSESLYASADVARPLFSSKRLIDKPPPVPRSPHPLQRAPTSTVQPSDPHSSAQYTSPFDEGEGRNLVGDSYITPMEDYQDPDGLFDDDEKWVAHKSSTDVSGAAAHASRESLSDAATLQLPYNSGRAESDALYISNPGYSTIDNQLMKKDSERHVYASINKPQQEMDYSKDYQEVENTAHFRINSNYERATLGTPPPPPQV